MQKLKTDTYLPKSPDFHCICWQQLLDWTVERICLPIFFFNLSNNYAAVLNSPRCWAVCSTSGGGEEGHSPKWSTQQRCTINPTSWVTEMTQYELKQPNKMTQQPQPSGLVEKITQHFLECNMKVCIFYF